ncbi:MAG: GNAT family N-acetyltransferase [Desulfobacterales bacterium]|nr:GNAT family N-acetyltransferase [Desulfobacterales bacterium]
MSEPAPPCEVSRLTIPADVRYADIAARYAADVARSAGFDEKSQDLIGQGLQAALPALIAYSFEPGERAELDIACERIPAGLKIVLRDKGLPFSCDATRELDGCTPAQTVLNLRDHFDEIHFNNLGPEGKEVVLVKHRRDAALAEYEAACRIDPPEAPEAAPPLPRAEAHCIIRPFAAADAMEISKTVYKTYGYSYAHDYIYYPEKIIALNASGKLLSALAVTEQNEIVGHCALSLWEDNPKIAELGQGVVVPSHRAQGCFSKLTAHLIGAAQARGLEGVFTEAVAVHVFSQKSARQHGLKDCALFVGLVPPGVDFKRLGGPPTGRGSMLLQFKHLKPPDAAAVYAPARHAAMIRAIYAHLDSASVPAILAPPEHSTADGPGSYTVGMVRSLNFARIRIDCFAEDTVAAVRRRLHDLCLERWDVIHLVLNLSDPQSALLCERFEAFGFFFAGILPRGLSSGDALILQYVNTLRAPYDTIRTASAFGAELAAYVHACDQEASIAPLAD